ncbi:hypothetical protein J4W42_22560, partial [Escherichia coli]
MSSYVRGAAMHCQNPQFWRFLTSKTGKNVSIRRQLVLPTRANYTGRTLQCDIKSRLLLPSLSFSCSFHLSVR